MRAYDWQGRPRITTNPDNTTREASYGGCGCAGGAVVTLRGEEMMISGVARRRQQTITHDALGRAIRADEMNWDGTVYRSLRTTYNARDQVTEARQEGGSASARVSTINYDGHGRVASEQRPEQSAPTSYLYYPDDMVQQMTDARGATANFLYNARHLVTQVSYTTPNSTVIPHTPTVNYSYDAAGNRLSMTDGLGTVDYAYDSLSRLASETRQFTGVPRSHQLSYQYNLAGGLTRITDPFDSQVNYQHDRVGQVTSVTGAGVGSAPVYVANVQYRAWGAARRVTYGNQVYAEVEYNTRLQPTRFEVRRVSGENPTIMLSTYQYHADGRIRFASNEQDHTFDRAYSFDHVGRLQEAYTAGEARNFRDNLAGGTNEGAYRQSYNHDEWDNLTSRVGRFWSGFDSFTQTVNGRNQNPTYLYDAQGNLTQDEHRTYLWDAAGRMVYSQDLSDATRNLTQDYDGDGRRAKRVGLNEYAQLTTSFYVTSSVVGGRTIAEVDGSGNKVKGYVLLGGEVIATQENNQVAWTHRDPVTASRVVTHQNGTGWLDAEHDPMGVSVGFVDPFVFGGGGIEPEIPTFVPNEFGGGNCTLDGMPLDCARVAQLLGSGGAEPCRNNDCGPQAIYSRSQGRFIGLTTSFMAFANGVSGYFLPSGEGETPQAQADAYARRVSGRSGGIDSPRSGSSGIFGFVNMFMPQEGRPVPPITEPQQQNNPDCWTINRLLRNQQFLQALEQAWRDTMRSGRENGGWGFVDGHYNDLRMHRAPEGERSSMGESEVTAFRNLQREFGQSSRPMRHILDFHTHPLRDNNPSGGDIFNIANPGKSRRAIGVIIYGPGRYSFYGRTGPLYRSDRYSDIYNPRLDDCL